MKTDICRVFCRLLAVGGLAAIIPEAASEGVWIEAGPAVRGGMQFKVTGSSYVQTLGRHTAPGPLREPGSIGPSGDYADRTYADGYVKLDPGTLNPDAVGGMGNTWNWAYNDAGQFDSSANTLTFHQQGEVGYTTLRDTPVTGQTDAVGVGVQVQAGWNVLRRDKWRVDAGVGFQGIWGANSEVTRSSYLERTSRLNLTDTYNVAGAVDPVTGFPGPQTAAGGYQGQFDVPGPVIPNVPGSRTSQPTDFSTAQNRVDFQFATDVYEITFSPRLTYVATPKIDLNFTPKLGTSYLSVNVDRTETFTQTAGGGGTTSAGRWHDQRTDGGWCFALGFTVGADADLGGGYYAGVFGGYEWAVGDVSVKIGPNTATVNGSGYVAGLVVGKQF